MCCGTIHSDATSRAHRGALACLLLGAIARGRPRTGAYNRKSFGYGVEPSRGHRGIGTELDLIVGYRLNERVGLQAGYAHLFGQGVLRDSGDDDVRFGYFQVSLSY